MSRKEDLESSIRESYEIVRGYETILRTSDRPEDKLRARRVIDEQWEQVRGYLAEYRPLIDELPNDIAHIVSRFSSLLELSKVEQAIDAQEQLQGILPGDQLAAALSLLHEKRRSVHAQLWGDGVIAQEGSTVSTGDGVAVGGDVGGPVIIAREGSTVIVRQAPVETPAVEASSALGRYLRHVISRNRTLRLQGIRSGGKLVHIELEQIYIALRATRQRTVQAEEAWLQAEAGVVPGETRREGADVPRVHTETVTVSVNEALDAHERLAVLGDPGSGKTTLLRYLALLYAHDVAEETTVVKERLGLDESGRLPILLPLRRLGAYLKAHRPVNDGTEGHQLLLDHLYQVLKGERIALPADFFDAYLENGQAVVLLDGLDEVADPDLRRRVSRMVEAFATAYPKCRYVVTSRIVGYTGPARLGEGFATTTVRDFTLTDVERFLCNWHLAVAVGQMGPGESAEAYAEEQTRQLLSAIRGNARIRELAINPLMLTVIALVHRDRVKLPDRRAELYDEAVNVLLGKWDEAKGVQDVAIFADRPFDAGDKRLVLQTVALRMHERQQKEIEAADLRRPLGDVFHGVIGDWRGVGRAVDRFLEVIQERTGLLGEHGLGVYRFSHLTFQEYLAARAIAGRDDYVDFTLQRVGDPWWREVILLEAGHLSMESRERTTRLIKAIADCSDEPAPYYNLVLALDCLRDVGSGRVTGNALAEVQRRLRADLEVDLRQEIARRVPRSGWDKLWRQVRGQDRLDVKSIVREIIERRVTVINALVRSGSGYWKPPHGEPEWIEIPAGAFWLGEGHEIHRVSLGTFYVSRVPITNAQYQIFVEATGHRLPPGWDDDRPAKEMLSHPVVTVNWHDALAYCGWLSQVTGTRITLPSEAEWEKAARGSQDQRAYPWGEGFEATRCNCRELGLEATTPVGVFPDGASPYGVLDMAGNVWEWTRSVDADYPYDPTDGREDLAAGGARVLRGGAFSFESSFARCAARDWSVPGNGDRRVGFRVVVSPGLHMETLNH